MCLKSSAEWFGSPDYAGIQILDPDGWDRKNFDVSWNELITEDEFCKRLTNSTCIFDSKLMEKWFHVTPRDPTGQALLS